MDTAKFEDLVGKTLSAVIVSEDKDMITFITTAGEQYRLHHYQDCCETVLLEDVVGDLSDLIGFPLVQAEESLSENNGDPPPPDAYIGSSWTWTFYKLATNKGSVTLRWLGSSNGYYSEAVEFSKI